MLSTASFSPVYTSIFGRVSVFLAIWQVTLRSCVMEFVPLTAYSTFTFTFLYVITSAVSLSNSVTNVN